MKIFGRRAQGATRFQAPGRVGPRRHQQKRCCSCTRSLFGACPVVEHVVWFVVVVEVYVWGTARNSPYEVEFTDAHATAMQPAYSTLKTNSGIRISSMIGGDGFTALRCVKGHVPAHPGAGAVGSHNSEMISMVCS